MQTPEQPPTPPPSAPPPAAPPAYVPQPSPAGQGQHGMAIAGFVCGLIGLFTTWCLLGLPLSILGIVFGAIGRTRNTERGVSTGLPLAGLICGIVGIFTLVLVAIFGHISTSPSSGS